MLLNIIICSALFLGLGTFASNVVGYEGRWWMRWVLGALGIDIGNKIYSIGYWGGSVLGIPIMIAIICGTTIVFAWFLKHDREMGVLLGRVIDWIKARIADYKRTH